MSLKAIIMDGDGSTITHDGVFPDNLRKLMINKPDVKWIMATGRSLDLLRRLPIINYLSTDVPHIVDGGSRLVKHDGTSVIDHYLSVDEILSFFAQIEVDKVDFLYYYLDDSNRFLYSRNLEYWHQKPQFYTALATDNIDQYQQWALQKPPTKIFIRINDVISLTGLNWHQNEQNIDVTSNGVTKGTSCVKLLNYLRIQPQDTAFVFNDRNDLPLVEHPDLSGIIKIKVGNYLPDTAADYYAETPYHVAPILEDII